MSADGCSRDNTESPRAEPAIRIAVLIHWHRLRCLLIWNDEIGEEGIREVRERVHSNELTIATNGLAVARNGVGNEMVR